MLRVGLLRIGLLLVWLLCIRLLRVSRVLLVVVGSHVIILGGRHVGHSSFFLSNTPMQGASNSQRVDVSELDCQIVAGDLGER